MGALSRNGAAHKLARGAPGEACAGAIGHRPARRSILAPHPALPAALRGHLIQHREQITIVQFADIGFMTLGYTSDLQMRDASGGQPLTDLHRYIAFDDLAVIEIHLHAHIRLADFINKRVRLILAAHEVAGVVALIEGLDQQRDAKWRSAAGGLAKIRNLGGP